MAVVYGLLNTVTNKVYVGCTGGRKTAQRKYNKTIASLIAKRFREHRCALRAGGHAEPELQQDWVRYGEQAFKMVLLEDLGELYPTAPEKRAAELRWMKVYEEKGLLYNTYKISFDFTKEATRAGIEASRTAGRWRNGVPADHGRKISEGKRRARELRQFNKIV